MIINCMSIINIEVYDLVLVPLKRWRAPRPVQLLIFIEPSYVISVSFCFRFSHSVFDRDYKATIGVDFEVEKFNILTVPFTLQV